jgi:hypothetical protein
MRAVAFERNARKTACLQKSMGGAHEDPMRSFAQVTGGRPDW